MSRLLFWRFGIFAQTIAATATVAVWAVPSAVSTEGFVTPASAALATWTVPTAAASGAVAGYAVEVLADSPLGYWRLDEASGPFLDASGHGLTGTIVAGTFTRQVSGALSDGSYGVTSVPGATIDVVGGLQFGTASFSLEMWLKPTSYVYPRSSFIMSKCGTPRPGTGVPGFAMGEVYHATYPTLIISDGTTTINSGVAFDTGSQPSDWIGRWTHVVVVFDRTIGRIIFFVDGVQQANQLDISTITGSVSSAGNLRIAQCVGWQLDGDMDDVAIYGTVLSPARVLAHYRAALAQSSAATASAAAWTVPTYVVPTGTRASSRVLVVASESRILTPAADPRTLTPLAESRTLIAERE